MKINETMKTSKEQLIHKISEALLMIENLTSNQSEEVISGAFGNSLGSARRDFRRIVRANEKRSAVAIFGQSQVGKSYLVHNLAKNPDSQFLRIEAGIECYDFLSDMNPAGGRESTGCVTRFTTNEYGLNPQYPFKAELFTHLDLAAILTNAYLSDIKDYHGTSADLLERINDVIETLELRNQEDKTMRDDLTDFSEYITVRFNDSFIIKELRTVGFFSKIQNTLSRCDVNDHWRLLQFLWRQNDFMNDLYRKLVGFLKNLDFRYSVFLSPEALTPAISTILDVERVRELLTQDRVGQSVKVYVGDRELSVDRACLATIVKEVALTIEGKELMDDDSYLLHTDLLDFPGSKSREKIPEATFDNNTAVDNLQLFIRGKISYLFDTYSSNLAVSSLLYCMDNNPPEELEAPERLARWVHKYVGSNPGKRYDRISQVREILPENLRKMPISPLMVVLTKFDSELYRSLPGRESDSNFHDEKWNARLEENFKKFMQRPVQDKWIDNFDEVNSSFRFVFAVRDPIHSRAIFESDSERKELRVRPEHFKTLTAVGNSFLNHTAVRRFIPEPEKLWNELSSPNGTGITHLRNYLRGAVDPSLVEAQFTDLLEEVKEELTTLLAPFAFTGSLEEDRERLLLKARTTDLVLLGLVNKAPRDLANLFQSFVLEDESVWELLKDHKLQEMSREHNSYAVNSNSITRVIDDLRARGIHLEIGMSKDDVQRLFADHFHFPLREVDQAVKGMLGYDIGDLSYALRIHAEESGHSVSMKILEFWTSRIVDEIERNVEGYFLTELQREAFLGLVFELQKSLKFSDLKTEIDTIIERYLVGRVNHSRFDLVSSVIATKLNNYWFSLANSMSSDDSINQGDERDVDFYDFEDFVKKRRFLTDFGVAIPSLYENNIVQEYGARDMNTIDIGQRMNEIIANLQ